MGQVCEIRYKKKVGMLVYSCHIILSKDLNMNHVCQHITRRMLMHKKCEDLLMDVQNAILHLSNIPYLSRQTKIEWNIPRNILFNAI
jgi:hypothetical protein